MRLFDLCQRACRGRKKGLESSVRGRTVERHPINDFPQVVGDPDGRGPVENLVPGKIVRDFLGVTAGGFIVGQFRPEAVEDRHPINDMKMISPHNARMNWAKTRSCLTNV